MPRSPQKLLETHTLLRTARLILLLILALLAAPAFGQATTPSSGDGIDLAGDWKSQLGDDRAGLIPHTTIPDGGQSPYRVPGPSRATWVKRDISGTGARSACSRDSKQLAPVPRVSEWSWDRFASPVIRFTPVEDCWEAMAEIR